MTPLRVIFCGIISSMKDTVADKKILHEKIDALPSELTGEVMRYVEFLEFSYEDLGAPESVEIRSKKELEEKLQEGLDDIEAGRMRPWSEVYTDLQRIYN